MQDLTPFILKRKIIGSFTIITFCGFLLSCYSTKEKDVNDISKWKGRKAYGASVLVVYKRSGEIIKFSKKYTGRLVVGGVQGRILIKKFPPNYKKVFIPFSEIKSVKVKYYNVGKTWLLSVIIVLMPGIVITIFANPVEML